LYKVRWKAKMLLELFNGDVERGEVAFVGKAVVGNHSPAAANAEVRRNV
jgi:hypothetical protein